MFLHKRKFSCVISNIIGYNLMCRNFLHMSGTSSHHTVCTSTQKYCHLKAKQKVQVFVVTTEKDKIVYRLI